MQTRLPLRQMLTLGALFGSLLLNSGCKQSNTSPEHAAKSVASAPEQPKALPPDDQEISSNIQAKINAESALNGQNIQVRVASGVATLTGSVSNDASRALAAADSGSVDGVRTVVNNLTIERPKTVAKKAPRPSRRDRSRGEQTATAAPPPPPPAAVPPPPPSQPEPVRTIAPPPPPPPPPVKTVTLQAGTVLPIRMIDTLDSKSTETDSAFHGSLASDLIVDGMVAIPRGASVIGRVITAKDATHFSGSSELSIQLTQIQAQGREIPVVTDTYTKKGAARGKNTAMKTGGGAALGALIGALAGGGKGAAIGAATGGGIGAGTNGVTRGQQVQIPSETLVNFNLQTPISVTTSRVARPSGSNSNFNNNGPTLKRAPEE